MKKFDSGLKAAVLGLTTHYIPNWENPKHIQGLRFEDALLTAKKWVNYIHEKEKPDILILAYHAVLSGILKQAGKRRTKQGRTRRIGFVMKLKESISCLQGISIEK